jgi:cephalosporin hydroxylase
MEDGIMDVFWGGKGPGSFGDGPLAATDEFLLTDSHFVVDTSRERYIITENPKGFLKRVS